MTFASRLTDSVVRKRASLIAGGYGNQARDWANATSVTYPARVHPVSSTEDVVNQQRTETRWKLYLGPDADLEATDRIEWDDGGGVATYDIDGGIERHPRLSGQAHHIKAILLRVDIAAG